MHATALSKQYALEGGGSVMAVRQTSLGVAPNTVFGLLGPNGVPLGGCASPRNVL